ncbi:Transcription factor bHLH94 [Platanthera guangdongensis]|uniref:Transcription factor bHLH94 n=1 Tax=Platanthera guangdongensis TaxID=2320717 RepID=A0ABR2LQA4_9ASPA
MSFEMLASSSFFNVCDTIFATPELHHQQPANFLFDSAGGFLNPDPSVLYSLPTEAVAAAPPPPQVTPPPASQLQGKRKRRRRPRSCKNKEEAETQRMTHIAVERNRRRQMNEHLSMLRSLMPESYIQRSFLSLAINALQGDQASIVGGAIDFVKELEHLLQSLEVQKRTIQQTQTPNNSCINDESNLPPFAQFFSYPQYSWCHSGQEYPPPAPETRPPALADIEVTLIETHASLRILSPRRPRQLIQLVAGLQSLRLSILHLNVTTLDSMILFSLSLKVEEGCSLTTVDDIAAAVHHILSLVEAEAISAASQALHDDFANSPTRPPLSF